MTFARLWVLHFLWLVPLFIFGLIFSVKHRRRTLNRFADSKLLPRLTEPDKKGALFLKGLLFACALTSMLIALAGPRWGSHYQEVARKGVDIILAVDVSRSMLTGDVKPTRLERAKRELIDFMRVVRGDRLGLVVFAGAAFVQCPLTLDYGALEMFVNSIEPALIPIQGTDLGAAIEAGISAFDPETETDKVMILITDGEDNEETGVDAARKADEEGVKIFVFGVGDPSGGPVPADDAKGGFKKDRTGNLIMSRLNEEGLKQIAALTDGVYIRSVAGDLDLDILYFDGIKAKTDDATLKSGKIRVDEERFPFFVLTAILFLLLEGIIETTEKPAGVGQLKPKKEPGLKIASHQSSHRREGISQSKKGLSQTMPTILFVGLTLSSLFLAVGSRATENPDELYKQGRYAEAEKAYAKKDMDHPQTTRFRYNRGCAAYQNSDYKGAAAAFKSVIRRSNDPQIIFRSLYNLGDTAFKQGDFNAAADYFKKALVYNPDSQDARYNIELTLRELKKQKDKENKDQKNKAGEKNKKDKPKNNQNNGQDKNKDTTKPDNQNKGPSKQQNKNDQNKKDEPGRDKKNRDTSAPKEQEQTDMSGELSGPEKTSSEKPEQKKNKASEPFQAALDKQKAEALLNNIQDNPARFMKFNIPRDKRQTRSGKDW
jgi:Ca-activated chloride channel family protein